MNKIIISTVGTSLLTNYLRTINKNISDIDKEKIFNKKPSEDIENYKEFEKNFSSLKEKLKNFAKIDWPFASAEIASLSKIIEKYKHSQLKIYLLATDTYIGYFVSNVLKEIFKKQLPDGIKIESIFVPKLYVFKNKDLDEGINNLIDEIYKIIVKDESTKRIYESKDVIFNITGGFKATIPYISAFAYIFNYPLVYIYDESSIREKIELVEIKNLPIEIDRSLIEFFYPFLSEEIELLPSEIKKLLQEKGLIKNNSLTPLGKLITLTVENTPIDKGLFGYFVELLIYEYFTNIMIKKNFKKESALKGFEYNKILRGYKINDKKNINLAEIDILLINENTKEFAWIESKPLRAVKKSDLKKQINRHIKVLKNLNNLESILKGYKLVKYILVVYVFDIFTFKFNLEKLKNLKNSFKDKINFEVVLLELPTAKLLLDQSTYNKIMGDFKIEKLKTLDENLLKNQEKKKLLEQSNPKRKTKKNVFNPIMKIALEEALRKKKK